MSMNDPEQKGDAAGGHMILSSRERYLTFEISSLLICLEDPIGFTNFLESFRLFKLAM